MLAFFMAARRGASKAKGDRIGGQDRQGQEQGEHRSGGKIHHSIRTPTKIIAK
jgi:hypothetical protein